MSLTSTYEFALDLRQENNNRSGLPPASSERFPACLEMRATVLLEYRA